MKLDVMVVGIKAVDNDLIELELQPILQGMEQDNKEGILTSIMSGNVSKILNEVGKHKRVNHKILVSREWCIKNSIQLFHGISLTIDVDSKT